jgi:hypothetical protein
MRRSIAVLMMMTAPIGTTASSASVRPSPGDPVTADLVETLVPRATPISEAKTSLRYLGASCQRKQANHIVERCEYDGPTMFDGDLIETAYRTVALNVRDGRVTSIAVKRKLDIH